MANFEQWAKESREAFNRTWQNTLGVDAAFAAIARLGWVAGETNVCERAHLLLNGEEVPDEVRSVQVESLEDFIQDMDGDIEYDARVETGADAYLAGKPMDLTQSDNWVFGWNLAAKVAKRAMKATVDVLQHASLPHPEVATIHVEIDPSFFADKVDAAVADFADGVKAGLAGEAPRTTPSDRPWRKGWQMGREQMEVAHDTFQRQSVQLASTSATLATASEELNRQKAAVAAHIDGRGKDLGLENDQKLYEAFGFYDVYPSIPTIEEHRRLCDKHRSQAYRRPDEATRTARLEGLAKALGLDPDTAADHLVIAAFQDQYEKGYKSGFASQESRLDYLLANANGGEYVFFAGTKADQLNKVIQELRRKLFLALPVDKPDLAKNDLANLVVTCRAGISSSAPKMMTQEGALLEQSILGLRAHRDRKSSRIALLLEQYDAVLIDNGRLRGCLSTFGFTDEQINTLKADDLPSVPHIFGKKMELALWKALGDTWDKVAQDLRTKFAK